MIRPANYVKCVNLIVACPIKGQIRKRCALLPCCHSTCNSTEPILYPPICVPDGCECPNGTVIDVEENECVAPRECPGLCLQLIYN